MKIIKLEAENFKRLRAIEITPDGNLVVISGKNASGKTSTLDAIWAALAGGAAARNTTKPIRDGEKSAKVTLDLGDLIVTRTWTSDNNTALKVTSKDGATYSSPQTMLDSLVGRLSFDPLHFAQQPAREQLAALLELVDLPFDPDELAAERARLFDERTNVGRDARNLEAQVAGLDPVPPGTPADEVDVAALREEWQEGVRLANEAGDAAREVRDATDALNAARDDVADLENRLAAAERRVTDRMTALSRAEDALVAANDLVPDGKALEERMNAAEATNRDVRARHQRDQLTARATTARDQQTSLTDHIEALDKKRADAIAAAAMPIDGLGFDDTGVTYQGVPFKQASSAEQLRVSIAMAIALNPTVRVVRITDGSLLDSDNMRLIEQMAGEHDVQVWCEVVDESGQVGIVIEDGAVLGGDPS